MRAFLWCLPSGVLAAALFVPSLAMGQTPNVETESADTEPEPDSAVDSPPMESAKSPTPDDETAPDSGDEEPQQEPTPPASNTLAGRFTLSLMGGVVVPFGPLEEGLPWLDASGVGVVGALEPTVGVSRTVSIGVWGQVERFGEGDACRDCDTLGMAGGPLVRYHLVEGLRFDPWLSMGVGLHSIRVKSDDDFTYLGLDWMRLTVGGDWYLSSNFALAPYLQLVGGTAIDRPATPPVGERPFDDHETVYWTFSSGLRLTLSAPGR